MRESTVRRKVSLSASPNCCTIRLPEAATRLRSTKRKTQSSSERASIGSELLGVNGGILSRADIWRSKRRTVGRDRLIGLIFGRRGLLWLCLTLRPEFGHTGSQQY